jgi:hypothetical protein
LLKLSRKDDRLFSDQVNIQENQTIEDPKCIIESTKPLSHRKTSSSLEKENFTFGKPDLQKKGAPFFGREGIKEEGRKGKPIR